MQVTLDAIGRFYQSRGAQTAKSDGPNRQSRLFQRHFGPARDARHK
jgi:hypothetical protein